MNENYGLIIPDSSVEILGDFLGMGNPIESNIWFIGNEEKFMDNENVGDHLDLYDLRNMSLRFNIDRGFFSMPYNNLPIGMSPIGDKKKHEIYKIIEKNFRSNLGEVFLGEVYFLPSENGNSIYKTYKSEPSESISRSEFYKSIPSLFKKLETRMLVLKKILDDSQERKYIIFYGQDFEKRNFLSSVFEKEETTKELLLKDKRVRKINYGNHILIICPFLMRGYGTNYITDQDLQDIKEYLIS